MNKVGIVGNGYVGGAIAHGFSPTSTGNCEVKVYDKLPERSLHTLEETVNESDFIFVSVPTPMTKEGAISLKYIDQVFKEINEVNNRTDNIVILKSTVVPGTTEKLQEKFPELNIIFNPEFLTERSSRLDFINQSRIVLGGAKKYTEKVSKLYTDRFKYCNVIETDYKTSEIVKYFSNIFFSVKVAFANEMKLICEKIEADWDTALEGFVADGRIADSHLNVPGPDGKRGFGGSCFPKDINAFMAFSKSIGVNTHTINGAWETNLEVRPEQDWKELKGRAIDEDQDES